mgnify:CR=1 FL=1
MRPISVGSLILALRRSRGTVPGVSHSLFKHSECRPRVLKTFSFRLAFILHVSICTSSGYAETLDGLDKTPVEIKLTDRVPYGREPVDYFGMESHDAVSELQKRLESGTVGLSAHNRFGYLLSVAELLDVPLESQLLVYSKTARAPALVNPATPRAVFFNDEVSVAWIPGARELELTAIDPVKGVICYTLSQPLDASPEEPATAKTDGKATPLFQRRNGCLACHSARSSLEVPGLLLRAFETDKTGKPIMGFSRVSHDMTYERRWGGWYVTGAPLSVIHRGNLARQSEDTDQQRPPVSASTLSDLSQKLDENAYPYPASDFVAHLVMAHQAHGTNLLIRAGLEARLNRRSDVETQLVRYFVFADEPSLDLTPSVATSVLRDSEFAKTFVRRGRRDAAGNSLRDLTLAGRVFKHRLSFLIHSRLFDELPDECRRRLLERLWAGLNSQPDDEQFGHLRTHERQSLIAIVRATVPRLPGCWQEGPTSKF